MSSCGRRPSTTFPRGIRLVEEADGQTRLSLTAEDHVARIHWGGDIAQTLRPAGTGSPVVIDPVRAFGLPSLEGRNLRTEVIAELFEAGDSPDDIADAYDLTSAQVLAALRWELGRAVG